MKNEEYTYLGGLMQGIGSLLTGMKTTIKVYFRKKVTEQYPETSETIETEEGKKKKILAKYEYDLGSCIFCQLCVNACPHDAITFDQVFEHAVFDRTKLVLQLNREGSKVIEKKKE